MLQNIKIFDLGLCDYKDALAFQEEVFAQVKDSLLESALIVCRHHPVITLGRAAKKTNVLAGITQLQASNIPVYEVPRGGDVTYHGPGQLIAYPVFNLALIKKDIHYFLRLLEDTAIDMLAGFNIRGERKQGFTGVWVGEEKISSIGIAIKNWVSFHGISLNVKKDDLGNFSFIRPCGMDIKMTCLESLAQGTIDFDEVKDSLIAGFNKTFVISE